jgi:hypothetical protein
MLHKHLPSCVAMQAGAQQQQQQQHAAAACEDRVAELFAAASSRAAALARTFEPGAATASAAPLAGAAGAGGGELLLQGLGGSGDLELPLISKFLLVSGAQRAQPCAWEGPATQRPGGRLTAVRLP